MGLIGFVHNNQPYVPSLGRMAVPSSPGAPNRYASAGNDPVNAGIGGADDESPDSWVFPGGAVPTQRQLYAPFLRGVNAGSQAGMTGLQVAAGFNPLYIAGEAFTGKDLRNCDVPAWQRAIDVAATVLPFAKIPKINLLPENLRVQGSELIRSITSKYDLLQCEECANALVRSLKKAGIPGEVIELRGGDRFIVSEAAGESQSISENGRHIGVKVGNIVFDNIHKAGVPFEQWLRDFDSPVGIRIHARRPF